MNDTSRQPTVVRSGEGTVITAVGDRYRFLAVGGDTAGRYAIWHATVYPGGGPPPHVHTREEEGFYVLKGELTFFADGQSFVGGPGTFVNLPVGGEHRFRNETDEPVEVLILVAPAGLEEMFRRTGVEVGTDTDTDTTEPPVVTPEEVERIKSIAPEYGVEIRLPEGHGH